MDDPIQLLREVYEQIGNHAPAERRHAVTPGLRDRIRDFLRDATPPHESRTFADLRAFAMKHNIKSMTQIELDAARTWRAGQISDEEFLKQLRG